MPAQSYDIELAHRIYATLVAEAEAPSPGDLTAFAEAAIAAARAFEAVRKG